MDLGDAPSTSDAPMATAGHGAAAAAPDNRSVRYKSKLESRLDAPGDVPHAAKQARASTSDGSKDEVTAPSEAEATRSSTDDSTMVLEVNAAEGRRTVQVSYDWQPEDTAEAVGLDMLDNEAISIDKNLNSLQDLTQQIEKQHATEMDVQSGDDDEQMKQETKLRGLAEAAHLSSVTDFLEATEGYRYISFNAKATRTLTCKAVASTLNALDLQLPDRLELLRAVIGRSEDVVAVERGPKSAKAPLVALCDAVAAGRLPELADQKQLARMLMAAGACVEHEGVDGRSAQELLGVPSIKVMGLVQMQTRLAQQQTSELDRFYSGDMSDDAASELQDERVKSAERALKRTGIEGSEGQCAQQ